jgi:hypothetical protein
VKAERKGKQPRSTAGRPPLEAPPISDEVRDEVLKFAATGAPDKILAAAVGVDPSTWSKWRLREELSFVQFFQEVARARARGDLALFACIRKAAGEGDWRAARSLLVSRHPELSERHQMQVSATVTAPDVLSAIAASVATQAPGLLGLANGGTMGADDGED